MYIARILYPVEVLGPGKRVGIWFDGCSHNCKGCSNPELHEINNDYFITIKSVQTLIQGIVDKGEVDGFTITGGDPFEQPEDLECLIDYLREISDDILVYSGYTYEHLLDLHSRILKKIAVLVDGEYVEEKNNCEVLRGSSNQRIIILNASYKEKYDVYINNNESKIQNFFINNSAVSVGIHKQGYEGEIDKVLKRKGLKTYE